MQSLVFSIICIQFLSLASPKAVLIYEKAECRAESNDMVKSVTCSLSPTYPPKYSLNFTTLVEAADLKVDMNLWASFFTRSKREKQILNITKNVCSILRKSKKGALWETFIRDTWRYSNLPTQCPLKKNVEYWVKNFIFDVSMIPEFMENSSMTLWMRFYKASHPKNGLILSINAKIHAVK